MFRGRKCQTKKSEFMKTSGNPVGSVSRGEMARYNTAPGYNAEESTEQTVFLGHSGLISGVFAKCEPCVNHHTHWMQWKSQKLGRLVHHGT